MDRRVAARRITRGRAAPFGAAPAARCGWSADGRPRPDAPKPAWEVAEAAGMTQDSPLCGERDEAVCSPQRTFLCGNDFAEIIGEIGGTGRWMSGIAVHCITVCATV